MSILKTLSVETKVKSTTSRCQFCNEMVPAEVVRVIQNGANQVVMRKTCEQHGFSETVISSDAHFYWHAEGNPVNRDAGTNGGCGSGCACSVGGGRDGFLGENALNEAKKGTIDKLSTCLALIEIVDSCNLSCPTCFADSPLGIGTKLKCHSFEDITSRIALNLGKKGHIDIIQFSGGEPTLHPDLFRLVEWVCSNEQIDCLLINTNGVRLAKDMTFVEEMGRLYKKFDNIQFYLQFDGPQEAGQVEIRGVDLRNVRERAIENCGLVNLPITFAMTVDATNFGHIWDTIDYARKYDHVRGVSFQPMFLSGRTTIGVKLPPPITVAHIINGLNDQSKGILLTDDFTPVPCGDPNCLVIGWLVRMGETFYSPSKFGINVAELQKLMPDKVNYDIEDLKKCGCDNTVLGEMMKQHAMRESNAFQIFIKPFMDGRTWDEDRVDRCCTHVIRPDGKLDSFCRYYNQQMQKNSTIR